MEETELMLERKKRILAYIESEEYRPMRRKEMRTMLSVPPEDREKFNALLDALLAEGQIFETRKGKIAAAKGLQMATGIFTGHSRGFGFVTPDEGGEDVFIPAGETGGALQKDKVLYKVLHRAEPGKKADGVVIRVLERGMGHIVGIYEESRRHGRSFGFVTADDRRIPKDIFIPRENSLGAVTGHKVVVEITEYGEGRRNPEGKVVEILGHVNDPGVDILSVVRRHDLPVEFPEAVYHEVEPLGSEIAPEDATGREDLRSILTITIDGEDAKDLDDAVSLERLENGNFLLGVHIADVSHYVREHTELDKEAYARGTSVYLVDRVIPMLPHKLSNGLCSLNPHADRLALSCSMEIDGKGAVVSHKITESVIHSNYRMTYAAVREILEDGTPSLLREYAEIVPMLREMDTLRQVLGEKRRRRGSVNFDLPEAKILLDGKGHPVDIRPYERSIATNMIEEFMLVCNETVAEDFFWQEIPFLFRSHMEPDEEKLEKMELFLRSFGFHLRKKDGELHPRELQKVLQSAEGTDIERIITRMVLRSMMQARYTAENTGHFGLAAKYYCHFTSPIRRYPDLQIHRLIKKTLHGEMDEKTAAAYHAKMPEIAKRCSQRERVADEAERDTEALKKVEYMEDKLGEVFEGVISGVTSWGLYVELPNTVEGMVALAQMDDDYYDFDERNMLVAGRRTGKIYRLGDRVIVTVAKADRALGTVDFIFGE